MNETYDNISDLLFADFAPAAPDDIKVGSQVAFPHYGKFKIGEVASLGRKNVKIRHSPLRGGGAREMVKAVPYDSLYVKE